MDSINQYKEIVFNSIETLLLGFVNAIPKVIAAMIVMLIGWLIARTLSTIIRKMGNKLQIDQLFSKINLDTLLEKANITSTPSQIAGKFVYWLVMLVFLVAASETIGWTIISEELTKLISLLPVIFSGLILFVIGYFIAGVVRDVLSGATESLGMSSGKVLTVIVYYFIIMMVTLSVLEHIGIDISIISSNLSLIIGAIVIGGALSYSLAARDVLANTLSNYYGKNTFEIGQEIQVDGVRGEIIEIKGIYVTLKTSKGKVVLPAKTLTANKVEILKEAETPAESE